MKIRRITLALILAIGIGGFCFAEDIEIPVTAEFPFNVELDHWVRWADSGDRETPAATPYEAGRSGDVTNDILNFGELIYDDELGIFLARKYFTVFLLADTSGFPYKLIQSCSGFSNTIDPNENLNDSLIMTPDYKEEDLWDQTNPDSQQGVHGDNDGVADAALVAASPGIGRVVYSSESGFSRIVRCYYGLATDDPDAEIPEPADAKVITADTRSGTYEGTITFTLVPNF
ncbi:MAG: hypothetical protein GY858_06955 [Candidatus Omnitrophica bacterium]|nr:hypothetical protein [Candidatus Omnitrophota bacterium]